MDKMKPAVLDDLVPSVDFMGLVKAMISPGKEHLMPKIELKTSVLNQTLFNDENMNVSWVEWACAQSSQRYKKILYLDL